MQKKLLAVIGFAILLASMVGYIVGSAPPKLIGINPDDQAQNPDQASNQDSTSASPTKTDLSKLPTFESLLVTAQTTPLPLSLQAGVFFDDEIAKTTATTITEYGYPATAQQFRGKDDNILSLVVLAPFKNEANLQLAKYELLKQHGIITQRIVTPNKSDP